MAPYLHLARAVGEEHQFYDIFFKVWFERWPKFEIPTNDSDSEEGSILESPVEELMKNFKKVCTSNTLTVAILTY
jgi:hypothetical protein